MSNNINTANMLRVGTILHGTYRIDRYLSSGGFGNTYVATNIQFGEQYAIKEFFMRGISQRDNNNTTVSVSNTDNRETFASQLEKFKKEARRLRKLNNEHIVRVHDLFEENGTAYYVMDYIDGENLSDRLKRTGKPLSEAEVMQLLPQILDALETAHKEGILHLDLKPANIMVDKQGVVKLIDFGASKQQSAQGGATTSTAVSYTNGYAPREQMEQNLEKFGPWTDFYALGATLYTLLTNKKPPLPSDIDDDGSEDKHLALPMPAAISERLRNIIIRLMNTNRKKRPQSVVGFQGLITVNDSEILVAKKDSKKCNLDDKEDNERNTLLLDKGDNKETGNVAENKGDESNHDIQDEATSNLIGKGSNRVKILVTFVLLAFVSIIIITVIGNNDRNRKAAFITAVDSDSTVVLGTDNTTCVDTNSSDPQTRDSDITTSRPVRNDKYDPSLNSNNLDSKSYDVRPRTIKIGRTVTTDLHRWRLRSIELRNDLTIVHWSVTSLQPETGIWVDNNIFIRDNSTGRIFRIIDSNNIGTSPSDPLRIPYANQTVDFETFFNALPDGVTSINYNMGRSTIRNINIK